MPLRPLEGLLSPVALSPCRDQFLCARTPKARAAEPKIDKWDDTKPNAAQQRRKSTVKKHREKMWVSQTFGKGLRFKLYSKKTNSPIQKQDVLKRRHCNGCREKIFNILSTRDMQVKTTMRSYLNLLKWQFLKTFIF
ncbi:Hypothetical predicted protein [Marmota monax]|uniref:Uncharacterized protein n=1 Tax=Marmota monax TaxID=9995 RepID=A0A5E4A2R9_MARMO|nr:hypothetical protein GHT09_001141 [Marmota monax]VTJ51166.1 Hypothetical predicted protein [Marmota monax]